MRGPDTNVLLYAVNADAEQHSTAARWLAEAFDAPGGVGLCWMVLLGFIRISTRAGIFAQPLSVESALRVVDHWLAQPTAQILEPGARHSVLLGCLLVGAGAAGNLTNDAHLAALAIEYGAIIGSFDRDFQRFAGVGHEWLGRR